MMKNAIVLFIYHNPEQVNFFIRQILKGTDMDIYVHINKKNDDIRHLLIEDPRVYVTPHNLPANWGDDGLCMAIIQMLREIYETSINYNHVVFASGQDLLVRPGLDQFLEKHPKEIFFDVSKTGDAFARAVLLHKWPSFYKRRIDLKWHPIRVMRSIRLRLIMAGCNFWKKTIEYDANSLVFYHNTFWGSMPMDVVRWIVNFINSNPGFIDMYKGAFVAEEKLLGTLFMMSPYKDWLSFDKQGKSHSLTYTKLITNNHPLILHKEDVNAIEESECFLARKFDMEIDKGVIDYFFNKICIQ